MTNLRRILCLVLIFAMLLPFAVMPANATETVVDPFHRSESNPLYPDTYCEVEAPDLNSPELAASSDLVYRSNVAGAGADIRKQMKKRMTTIEVGFKTTNSSGDYWYDLYELMFDAALVHTGVPTEGDYLKWQWGGWNAKASYTVGKDGYYYLRYVYTVKYYDTAAQEAELDIAVKNLLNGMKLEGKTDYQKICAIYDYICANVVYDYANLNNDAETLKRTAYGALMNGTAVCQGYAVLFYRLALELGIDCRLIAGDGGGPHGWNIVKLGNLYYNVDTTWDAGKSAYQYFMKCENHFYGHTRYAEYNTSDFHAKYPMSMVDFNPANYSVTTPAKPYKIVNVVSGVHVYWDKVANAQKYGVWRSETGVNGTYKWIANPTVPHFTDKNVQSGKTYHYKITAINPVSGEHTGKSQPASIIYVSTPDISARYNKAAGVKLEWKKIPGATGYAIYRKSYSGSDAWVRVATITNSSTLTWTDTSVASENGTVYRYTIRALAGQQRSILSGCRNTGRTMARLTSRTLTATIRAGAGSIKCQWNTTTAATGYEVRFMSNGQVIATFTVGNYKTGTKTFSGLPTGRTYQVQVRSYKQVSGVGTFYSAWSVAKNQAA